MLFSFFLFLLRFTGLRFMRNNTWGSIANKITLIYIYKKLESSGFFYAIFFLFLLRFTGLRFRTNNAWGSIANKITLIYIYTKNLKVRGFFMLIFFSLFIKVYGFKV